MDTIACPHCGKHFELTEAIKHRFEEDVTLRLREEHKKELLDERRRAQETSEKKFKEDFGHKIERMEGDVREKDERNKKLLEELSKLTDELRQSKKEKDEAAYEMKKTLAEEEGKIRIDAQKKAEEEHRMKLLEKDKQLEGALKEANDLRRKLEQGSQQLQGEAFELSFETALTTQYVHDKIVPVGKGIKGGDIIQEVWDARGNYVGKILWELKNTKTWGPSWIDKLKTDKRSINAEEAVLITEVLPPDMKIAGFKDSVWVTKQEFVIPLADTLRAKLIQMFYVKNSVQAKDQKMETLYSYLSGIEFRNRVEAIIEAFTSMQQEIEKEKRYFSNKWARDEKNIRQVIDNTFGMHGDFKGIIGAGLPHIKGIDMLGDGNE